MRAYSITSFLSSYNLLFSPLYLSPLCSLLSILFSPLFIRERIPYGQP